MPQWLDKKGNRRVVGHTVWETDTVKPHWVPILNRLDHLLVPSEWNRELFLKSGVRVPISVLPHIPGPSQPAPHERWSELPRDELLFYCIETWSARKNIEQAIVLFRSTFSASDGVRLIVKTSSLPEPGDKGILDRPMLRPLRPLRPILRKLPKSLSISAVRLFGDSTATRLRSIKSVIPEGAPVDIITEELTLAEIEGLHQRCDCYFSLTHGEGFGLGAFDATAAGNPVITTGWGGVLDFLDPAHSFLVDWDLAAAWNRPGTGNWAQPKLDHAARCLRAFRDDPIGARRRTQEAQARFNARFGAATLIPFLLNILAHD